MSIVAMNWAWDVQLAYLGDRDNKAGRRLLLVALGDNANEQGICWPSITTLARRCESSTKSVRRWLREFADHDLLSISHRHDAAGQTSNLYQLRLSRRVAEAPEQPGDTESPPTDTESGGRDTESTPTQGHGVRGPRTPDDQGPRTPGVPLTTNEPPMNPTHSQGAGDVFARAAQQGDDGQPLTAGAHQFAMTLDWQPDPEHLAAACKRAGLPADTRPAPHQLAKFTAHHADNPSRRHGAMAWTSKLVDWIRNDARQQAAQPQQQPTGGARHGNRTGSAGQRQRFSNLSAADARRELERRRRAQESGAPAGEVFDGELEPGH